MINERSSELAKIQTFHVSGKQSSGQRKTEIEKFRSAKPSLVSNARCLTEGVDIPEVDAVLFADPKQALSTLFKLLEERCGCIQINKLDT